MPDDFTDLRNLADNQIDFYLYIIELQTEDTQLLIIELQNELFDLKQKALLLKIEKMKRKQSSF